MLISIDSIIVYKCAAIFTPNSGVLIALKTSLLHRPQGDPKLEMATLVQRFETDFAKRVKW